MPRGTEDTGEQGRGTASQSQSTQGRHQAVAAPGMKAIRKDEEEVATGGGAGTGLRYSRVDSRIGICLQVCRAEPADKTTAWCSKYMKQDQGR